MSSSFTNLKAVIVSSYVEYPWTSSNVLLMEKPLSGKLFPWLNDKTHLANLNNWQYFKLPLSSNNVPIFAQYTSICLYFFSWRFSDKPQSSSALAPVRSFTPRRRSFFWIRNYVPFFFDVFNLIVFPLTFYLFNDTFPRVLISNIENYTKTIIS